MATDDLFPPQRSEQLTNDGRPTLRFLRYLEDNAQKTNTSFSEEDVQGSNLSIVTGQLSLLDKKVKALENEGGQYINLSPIMSKLKSIEIELDSFNTGAISSLDSRIKAIESATQLDNTGAISNLDSRVKAIENSMQLDNTSAIADLQLQINQIMQTIQV
jgi:hypothetical protein